MSDFKLLEMAAKAAGIAVSDHIGWLHDYFVDEITGKEWNPLTDDGDALRLAVKLGIGIDPDCGLQRCTAGNGEQETVYVIYAPDPYTATRRAIVKAAAEIGKACHDR